MTRRRPQRVQRPSDGTRGSVLVEAALVMPLVAVIFAGLTEWGLALYQYHLLSTATSEAVRQLVVSRGMAAPLDGVKKNYDTWAGTLGIGPGQITVEVQDPANATDFNYKSPACSTLTESNCAAQITAAVGRPARVSVNYACKMQFSPRFISLCPMKISMVGIIE